MFWFFVVILFELIHLWSPSRQNLDLTETRVFLRIYHLSAFISELCRPRSYYWFLLECNRKGFDLKTGLCYKWRTLRFFFFYQNDWIYTDFTEVFFPQCIKQYIIFTVNMYVTKWNSESFALIDAWDLSWCP